METLHRLAGVQDTADLSASHSDRLSAPHIISEPPPIPDDGDEGHNGADTGSLHSRRASRASLPLSRQRSRKSLQSGGERAPSVPAVDTDRGLSLSASGGAPNLADYPPSPRLALHLDKPQPALPADVRGRDSPEINIDNINTSDTNPASGEAGDGEEDFAWGPSHPCFPHPNPHCAPHSAEAQATRVIRVRRDWLMAGDTAPQFANLYPEILDPLVTEPDFRLLLGTVNGFLKAAYDARGRRAWVDAALGVATGFLWDDVGWTGAKRAAKGLAAFVDEWNALKAGERKGVRLIQPRITGFMALDFVVPDPGIDLVDGGEGAGEIRPAQ